MNRPVALQTVSPTVSQHSRPNKKGWKKDFQVALAHRVVRLRIAYVDSRFWEVASSIPSAPDKKSQSQNDCTEDPPCVKKATELSM